MEILKRSRNSEDISPKKCSQTNRLDKKIKLCSDVNFLVDDFEDDFFFEDESNFKMKNVENQEPNFQDIGKRIESKHWYRFQVKAFKIDSKNFDLITTLCNKENMEEIICRLQGPWCETKLIENSIISVFPIWSDEYKCYIVNKDHGFFITNPDYLISGTTVVGSIFCQRKAILQEKFRGIDPNNKIMTIGTIVHELMQTVLEKKISSEEKIEKSITEMLNSKDLIYLLYSSKMSLLEAEDEIRKFIPNIINFVEKYIRGNTSKISQGEFTEQIENIQDIEENLWIPQLGLKGKIDVSVKIHRRKKDLLLPLELKTGRSSFSLEHKGQVILYQMMLNELGVEADSGLLLYLRDGIMKEISSSRNEKRDLIILRNEISNYLTESVPLNNNTMKFQGMILPEPINHPTACSKCPYLTICTTFLKTDTTCNLSKQHPLNNLSSMATVHLKTIHIDYFMYWCGIISLEQNEINNSNNISNIWTVPPEKRFSQQKALINLQISGSVQFQNGRYIHNFIVGKNEDNCLQNNIVDLRLNGITKDEYVIISTTKRLSVAAGVICDLSSNSVSVCLERNLLNNYRNETFIIDKYESKSGQIFNTTNLGLLLENTEHISFLRDVIIEKKTSTYLKKLPAILAREGKPILQELNKIQQTAVLKALSTENYILIKGLPGTGKTQTLVSIIRLLHLLKKSVIITSHTHSAVDNVLLRLKQHNVPFLRLGSEKRIHPDLLEFSENEQTKNCSTPEELANIYNSFSIIGVTCLGSGHSIFMHKMDYDFCIVDEATQVYQPTIIRPLLFAKKFILVGDPDQLPPLIHSRKARELGADESLFHRLDSETATTSLTLQYRMNKVINKLANDLTYGDKLKCGNDKTMKASLNFPKQTLLLDKYSKQKWILKALEKHIDQSVIFLDTKDCRERSLSISKDLRIDMNEFTEVKLQEMNKQIEQKCVNYCEAAIVFILLEAFILGGYDGKNIGIIAPYRAQVVLLKKIQNEYIKNNKFGECTLNDVEINTVDQYQGRDKDIIIYSCTKTGKKDEKKPDLVKSVEILEDRRRLTVAITRSKLKLIIVGDQDCLKNYTPFNELINKIPNRCKQILEDDKLGFQWTDILTKIKSIGLN